MPHPCQSYRRDLIVAVLAATIVVTPKDEKNNIQLLQGGRKLLPLRLLNKLFPPCHHHHHNQVQKASKRSECRKYQKSSRSTKQRNRLDIDPFITQVRQVAQYSDTAPTRSNTEGYCRFCFDPLHISEVCPIVPPNFQMALLQKRDVNETGTFGNTLYGSMNRDTLQFQGLVLGKTYQVTAHSQTNFQQHLGPDRNQPRPSTQWKPLN